MFDSLRKRLRTISEEAEDAFTEEADEPEPSPEAAPEAAPEASTEAAGAPQPAPAAPAADADDAGAAASGGDGLREGGRTIDPDRVDDLLWDLELALLESDVAVEAVERVKTDLDERLRSMRVASREEVPERVEEALRETLLDLLSVETLDFDLWLMEQKKPAVIMFVGVNGTGKTTAIGRIAHRLKMDGYGCVLAAGDTFRAGAIEQLERHGENLGLRVVKHSAGSDPAAVAYDAIEHAKARRKEVVLLDTAGRMQTNANLMDEMKKIQRVAKPDLVVFVGDSLAGNDAVEQARKFDEAVGIDAVILTKVDTDAKGGAALSIAHAIGKPILFLGVGQDYGDLIPYDPRWMVDRIFDAAEA